MKSEKFQHLKTIFIITFNILLFLSSWDFVEILYSEWSISVVSYGHIRSSCSIIQAGGWNIWATDLLNYDRNPLPPNNWETVEDALFFCDETPSPHSLKIWAWRAH